MEFFFQIEPVGRSARDGSERRFGTHVGEKIPDTTSGVLSDAGTLVFCARLVQDQHFLGEGVPWAILCYVVFDFADFVSNSVSRTEERKNLRDVIRVQFRIGSEGKADTRDLGLNL